MLLASVHAWPRLPWLPHARTLEGQTMMGRTHLRRLESEVAPGCRARLLEQAEVRGRRSRLRLEKWKI